MYTPVFYAFTARILISLNVYNNIFVIAQLLIQLLVYFSPVISTIMFCKLFLTKHQELNFFIQTI